MNKMLFGTLVVLVLLVGGQSIQIYQLQGKLEAQVAERQDDGTASNQQESKTTKSITPKPKSRGLIGSSPWNFFGKDEQTLGAWNPFDEMQRMREEMDQMFGRSFSRFQKDPNFSQFFEDSSFSPRIDIEDLGDKYIVTIDTPGAKEANMNISIEDGQLLVSGETNSDSSQQDEEGSMIHQERFFGSFQRSIPLPDDIDEENIIQSYTDGVLKITIPKLK